MSLVQILTPREIKKFNNPESIPSSQKSTYFSSALVKRTEDKYYNESSRLGFLLQHGYFRAYQRFFKTENFRNDDILFCCNLLKINSQKYLNKKTWYKKSTVGLHRSKILKLEEFVSFSEFKPEFLKEVRSLLNKALKPKQIFFYLVNYLEDYKIEIPEYSSIAGFITNCLNDIESGFLNKIEILLNQEEKDFLDDFMSITVSEGEPSAHNQYLISTFKKPSQEISPTSIGKSVEEFKQISDVYEAFEFVLKEIKISEALIDYYANWMIIADQPQFNSIKDPRKKYLYLLSLISFQYRHRQDLFVDIFLKVVKKFKNGVEKSISKDFLDQKSNSSRHIQESRDRVLNKIESDGKRITKVRSILTSQSLNPDQKIRKALEVIEVSPSLKDQVLSEFIELEKSLSTGVKEEMYYNKLDTSSQKLSVRTKKLLLAINFNEKDSEESIYNAISHYKITDGSIRKYPPMEFLSKSQKKYLSIEDNLNVKIYRCLLMMESANRIKEGTLNLKYSNQYRSINNFLIDENTWNNQKSILLKRAKLDHLENSEAVLDNLSSKMDELYHSTNKSAEKNKYLSFNNKGTPIIKTPKKEEDEEELISNLFGQDRIIPIAQILKEVSEACNYLDCFSHYSLKGSQKLPDQNALLAGIIGLGCNIGVRKMAKITKGLRPDSQAKMVSWHFSKQNLKEAKNRVIGLMDDLVLPGYFKKSSEHEHTSSDGQKFGINVPSIHSNYSFKYLGKGKGITALNFMSETRGSFYDMIISPTERESTYTLDGILERDQVESTIHSTDTHGFTEILCGTCYSLGILFNPRLKNPGKQRIYTFRKNKRSKYVDLGYKILPTSIEYINTNLLVSQWDNILRFLVSIRLQEIKPSVLFKRLSSYSKTHPLYKALQELGRIHKTIYLLKYFDDVELRQNTEAQLNKTELWHDFAKYIWLARNQSFAVGDRVSQEVALACRNLIQNCIVAWNYMYLTDNLLKLPKDEIKIKLKNITSTKMIAWAHVNVLGEYDFDDLKNVTSNLNIEDLIHFDPNHY